MSLCGSCEKTFRAIGQKKQTSIRQQSLDKQKKKLKRLPLQFHHDKKPVPMQTFEQGSEKYVIPRLIATKRCQM